MATSSFCREIILSEESVDKLIKKIKYDREYPHKIKDIDVEAEMQEGRKLLRVIFDKNKKETLDRVELEINTECDDFIKFWEK